MIVFGSGWVKVGIFEWRMIMLGHGGEKKRNDHINEEDLNEDDSAMDEDQEQFLILGIEGWVGDRCQAGIRGGGEDDNHYGDVEGRDGSRREIGNDVAAVSPENRRIEQNDMGSEKEEN